MRVVVRTILLPVLWILAGCDGDNVGGRGETVDTIPEAIVVPDVREVEATPEKKKPIEPESIEPGGELFTNVYPAPPSRSGLGFPAPAGSESKRLTIRELLENGGVEFGPGASVSYGPESGIFIIRNTRKQLARVELLLAKWIEERNRRRRVINVRAEIYELPSSQMIELRGVSNGDEDSRRLLEFVGALVEQGEARLVTAAAVAAANGQHTRFEDCRERVLIAGYEWAPPGPGEEPEPFPVFETVRSGTILEIDPFYDEKGGTIELDVDLVHHLAPPARRVKEFRDPESGRTMELEVFEFDRMKLQSTVKMRPGQVKWLEPESPAGDIQNSGKDRMRVVFLSVNIQSSPESVP